MSRIGGFIPQVKICGIKSMETVDGIRSLPIDYVGFVFAESKRKVTALEARELIEAIRLDNEHAPKAVGVFVNPSLDELQHVISEAGLDVVQLHGNESATICQEVKDRFEVDVIKSVSIKSNGNVNDDPENKEQLVHRIVSYEQVVDALLLDTFDPVYGGGSGQTFNWEVIPHFQHYANQVGIPMFVAGGLHPDNVSELVGQYAPDGVDVSSGVETNGMKDIHKIKAFVERVKHK